MKALVTGASSGIGRDIARELAKRKYDIIAVARNEEGLKDVKNEIEKEYQVKVDVRAMDLIERDGCKKLHEDIKAKYTDSTLKGEWPKVEPKKELEEKKYIEIE